MKRSKDLQSSPMRKLEIDDSPSIVQLLSKIDEVEIPEWENVEVFSTVLSKGNTVAFGAFEDGELIGCIFCGNDGLRLYLHHLAISEGFRRQGIGQALVMRVFEYVRNRHEYEPTYPRRMLGTVLPGNQKMKLFCKKLRIEVLQESVVQIDF